MVVSLIDSACLEWRYLALRICQLLLVDKEESLLVDEVRV